MGKKGAGLLQREATALAHRTNIVELTVLESRRQIRQEVNELKRLTNTSTVSTAEMQQHLSHSVARYGALLPIQLLRSLQHKDINHTS